MRTRKIYRDAKDRGDWVPPESGSWDRCRSELCLKWRAARQSLQGRHQIFFLGTRQTKIADSHIFVVRASGGGQQLAFSTVPHPPIAGKKITGGVLERAAAIHLREGRTG